MAALVLLTLGFVAASASEPAAPELPPVDRPQVVEDSLPEAATDSEPPAVPDDATLEANGAVMGEILIRAGNIFDPERPDENNRVFRAANRLHRTTRQGVIRRLLLFKPGDRYSRRVLEESERILRSTMYLYDATIFPVRYENNRVAVEVVTRDIWTLRVGAGFSRSGGENTTHWGVKDSNFLGAGKQVSLRRVSDVDRTSYTYGYLDPNILGSRVQLQLSYADNSDGKYRLFDLDRPFFSLDSRWTARAQVLTDDRVQPLYDLGEVFDEFEQRQVRYLGYFGLSRGHVKGSTRRWSVGFTYERDRFASIPGVTQGELPEDRTLVYPWIGFQLVRDAFIETHDLDKLQRTEDINLGREFKTRLGWSFPVLGADREGAVFNLSYKLGTSPGQRQILLVTAYGSGRLNDGRGENLLGGGSLRYYLRDLSRHVFFVAMRIDAAHRLDREKQLLLGGDSGLRGYPLRYLNGDRRFLLTLEQRFYTDWHLFRLLYVGAAIFFDSGNAWFSGSGESGGGLFKDVGFGLRFSSSRSSSAAMVHVDLAFPLDGDSSIESTQLLITTRQTF